MHTLTITEVQKLYSIADQADYLDVSFDITAEGETVYQGRHGFPLDTSEEDITAQLTKFVGTYAEDKARAASNEKVEELHKQADETIANLEGLEINAESNQ